MLPSSPYKFTAKEREYRAHLGDSPPLIDASAPSRAVCSEGHDLSWHTHPVPAPIGDVIVMWCLECGGEA
jgi:hypothetical protein